MTTTFATRRRYTTPGRVRSTPGEFACLHCGALVSADALRSGVHNRNHCPACLSSRHLDQFEPGDRLSACKARMRPVGLTLKRSAKKYPGRGQGELMLVHECDDCGKLSINRIAADDDGERVLAVLRQSARLDSSLRARLARDGVEPLSAADVQVVRARLYGVEAAGCQG